jgi:post-segregation antitoxin (ccd killing protein)
MYNIQYGVFFMPKSTIFQEKKIDAQKALNIKVPKELHEKLEKIKKELSETAPNLSFNLSAICTRALQNAARKAERELESLKQERHG